MCALQFNPGAYSSAWKEGRDAEYANKNKFLEILQALGTIGQGFAQARTEKRADRKEASGIGLKLAEESNLSPEQINQVTQNYLNSGDLNLPVQASKEPVFSALQDKTGKNLGRPERTYAAVKFGKPEDKKGLLAFNTDTGKYEVPPNVPEGYGSFDVSSYSPSKANLYNTGAQTKEANAKDAKTVTTGDLQKTIESYQKLLQSQIPGTPEYDVVAQEMSPYVDELNARLKKSSVQPPAKTTPPPVSKNLTKEEKIRIATNILKEVGGDKEKARALAKQRGYSL